MRTIVLLVACVSLPISAVADLSDTEARVAAVRMEKIVAGAKRDLNGMIESGRRQEYANIRRQLLDAIKQWPEQNLRNSASFPYSQCLQSALSLLQYGDAWIRREQSIEWKAHIRKRFGDDEQDCHAAIANPDMRLKNLK